MMLEVDLLAFLLGVAPITNLVGTQIYGLRRPQGARPLPEILIQRTTTLRQVKFCGTDKLANALLQIDCYGIELFQAASLAKQVRQTLVDFHGMMAETYVDTLHIDNEFPMDDPEPGVMRMIQLYNVWYRED